MKKKTRMHKHILKQECISTCEKKNAQKRRTKMRNEEKIPEHSNAGMKNINIYKRERGKQKYKHI